MSAYEYQEKPTLTPRTDAAEQFDCVKVDFARTLEREIAAVTAERDELVARQCRTEKAHDDTRSALLSQIGKVAIERDALKAELSHIRAECVENGITPPSMTETQAFHGELSLLTNCATDGRNWRTMLQKLAAERDALQKRFAAVTDERDNARKEQPLTDRTARQERNVGLVQRIFAGAHARTPEAPVLKTADGEAQTARVERARQNPLDLRDAFLRATGRPSADIDGAWQENDKLTDSCAAHGPATPDAEYEIICCDECVASARGPRDDAWREAMHYAQQYSPDGEITIYEVTRRKVWPNEKVSDSPPLASTDTKTANGEFAAPIG